MPQFSARYSYGLGGNRHAGPFENMPAHLMSALTHSALFLDFTQPLDYVDAFSVADDVWEETDVGPASSPTIDAALDRTGGILVVNPGLANSAGIQTQLRTAAGSVNFSGSILLPADNKTTCFVTRFALTDADGVGAILGLALDDTTAISTAGAFSATVGIVFATSNSSADLTLECRRGAGTDSLAVATLSDNTFVTVGYRITHRDVSAATGNGTVDAFVYDETNRLWTLVGTSTDVTPSATALLPTLGAVNAAAATGDLEVDYILVATER